MDARRHLEVSRTVVARVTVAVECDERSGRPKIPFNSGGLDGFAPDGAAPGKVEGIQCELQDATFMGAMLQEEVVGQLHSQAKAKVVDPAGTKCPSLFGIFGRS